MSVFSSFIQTKLDDQFDYFNEADPVQSMRNLDRIQIERKEKELAEKRFIKPGFEQQYTLDYLRVGKREQKKRNKAERAQNAGPDWFNIKAPELDENIKLDLEVIKSRRALFKKHQYKRKATDEINPHFHLGKVIEDGSEFYSSRIPRKQRGTSIVDELVKDSQFMKSSKERYGNIVAKNNEYRKEKAIRQKKAKKQAAKKRGALKSEGKWKNRADELKKLKSVKRHQKRLKKRS